MTDLGALRIGCVKYLNARPLIVGWEGEVLFDHPSALCQQLARGELDAALVSSFEYLRNPIYTVVNDLAIACERNVYSVVVAHRAQFSALKTAAPDAASETSNNLLRCLIAEQQLSIEVKQSDDADAQLLIGDKALAFRQQHPDWQFWDLGAAWHDLTRLPFVFALWLVRPDVSDKEKLATRLRALRDRNLQRLDELAKDQQQLPHDLCIDYWTRYLHFQCGPREIQGLFRFREQCVKHRILPDQPLQFTCA